MNNEESNETKQTKETKEMDILVEKISSLQIPEFMATVLNICESEPDKGLELIELLKLKTSLDSVVLKCIYGFAKFIVYGSKGFLSQFKRLLLENYELADEIPDMQGWEFKEKFKLTDYHLDYLERALVEIKKIEAIDSHFVENIRDKEVRLGEAKIDAVATPLERCRPGKVQELLGKTKLKYYSDERLGTDKTHVKLAPGDYVFLDTFFEYPSIVKSAFIFHKGIHEKTGRQSIWVWLCEKPFNELGPDETIGDIRFPRVLYLYNDRKFDLSSPMPP